MSDEDKQETVVTYVYNGVEVKMTGRRAKKATRRQEHVLIEVTPYNQNDGTWTKWANPSELYEIHSTD